MTDIQPHPPGTDLDDDQDELDNQQLESSSVQKAMLPLYVVILLSGCLVGTVPIIIIISIVRTILYFSQNP